MDMQYNNYGNLSENFEENNTGFKKFTIVRKDVMFAFIFLAVSVFMSAFGIFCGFKAGFTVSLLAVLVAVTVYLYSAKTKIKFFPLISAFLSVGVTFSFLCTSNNAVRFFSFVFVFILDLIWFLSLVSDEKEEGDLALVFNIFAPFFKGITMNLPVSVYSVFSVDKNKKLGKTMLGIAISLPVLIVVLPLLISSDAAFSGMMEMIFGDFALTFIKLVFGLTIGVFLTSYCLSLKKDSLPVSRKSDFKGFENTIIISALSVISFCYLAYLFSQLAYFFSAFRGFLPPDYRFTVSAYARRGFFEMSVIAGINFVIIFLSLLLSRKNNGKSCVAIRILSTFIGVFTLVIISTAISKMVLYISSFGMTRLRIQTSAFMICLFVVFIALILRLYFAKIPVIRVGVLTAAVILTVLGTVNMNHFAANYNYVAYKNGSLKEIDVSAMADLGVEGIPYLIKLANEETEVSESAKTKVCRIIQDGGYMTVTKENGEYKVEFNEEKIKRLGGYSIPENKAANQLKNYVENSSQNIITQLESENNFYMDEENYY